MVKIVDKSNLVILQIPIGQMENYAYVIGDKSVGEAAVVDPGWEAEKILKEVEGAGFQVKKVFLTHTHYDHMNALKSVVESTGAMVFVNKIEAGCADLKDVTLQTTEDGSEIKVGSLKVKVLHTPGHTAGSQCFEVGGFLITGDTLFVHNTGRTDLPTGSREQMFKSLRRLSGLSKETVVLPGHNYGPSSTSTIEEENKMNPYMRIEEFDQF